MNRPNSENYAHQVCSFRTCVCVRTRARLCVEDFCNISEYLNTELIIKIRLMVSLCGEIVLPFPLESERFFTLVTASGI